MYNYDGLKTSHNHDFMLDSEFLEAYTFASNLIGKDYKWYWRNYIGIHIASLAQNINNNFVEFGVGDGWMVLSIIKHFDSKYKIIPKFHLFDTFDGIDTDLVTTDEERYWGCSAEERRKQMATHINSRETVEKRLSIACGSGHNIKIIEGSVPKTISDEVVDSILENGEISFMHIDMNNAEPEKAALEKLYKHVARGGFILLDDYGYNGFGFQKKAIDSVCQSIGCLPPLSLPTGQGLIIKA